MENDEFSEDGAQLRWVMRWRVVHQTRHQVALLTHGIAGEVGMEGMGKPERHRHQNGQVPHEGFFRDGGAESK